MPKQTFFNLPDTKRELILEKSVDEFAAKGYRQASISHIVAEAGIAKGSFYQYFEDKDDLYEHIIDTMVAGRKIQVYEQERKRLEDLSLTGFLRHVFHKQYEAFQQNPGVIRIAMDLYQLTSEPVYQRIMGKYQNAVNTYFLPYISHEIEQGEIDPAINRELLNFMLISLGQYMLYLLAPGNPESINGAMIDRMVDDLEYILTNGIYTDLVKQRG